MLNPQMVYSKSGESLTERFEGFRSLAYQDQKGVWTQGYGHTRGVGPNSPPINQAQAQDWLEADIETASQCVNQNVVPTLNQNQFDALVDFVFNLGAGNFVGSSLLRDLNSGNFNLAAGQFALWDHCGGQVVAGLLQRRQDEEQEFETAPQPESEPVSDQSNATS